MSLIEIQKQLGSQRTTRRQLEQQVQEGREALRSIQANKARLQRQGREDTEFYHGLVQREEALIAGLPKMVQQLQGVHAQMDDLLVEFHGLSPQTAVEQLDDHIPFFLFPVRLQTRFQEFTDPETGQLRNELWLRIYPDDINIVTHEAQLTEDEVRAARLYWLEVWRAGGDEIMEKGAWRALSSKYGFQRAAWIVQTYAPNNEVDETGQSNRPSSPLPYGTDPDPAPAFDDYEAKQESWSLPPRAMAMPDRFVVQGFIGQKKVMEQVGRPVPDPLIAGPDPSHPADSKEGFKEDAPTLEVDAEMKWMADFDEAVQVGMGMRIVLDDTTRNGVDRLVVLGLRLSDNAVQGKAELQRLIDQHHYEEDGFSLIPQGTATNNTGIKGAGFKSFDPSDDESFSFELGPALFDHQPHWKHKTDGQALAEILGVDPSVFHHIQFSDGYDQRDARAMNTALWPATLGYFLEEMMDPLFDTQTVGQTREFFIRYVSGRGAIPAIRVGNQPYGILAGSSFTRWRFPQPAIDITTGKTVINPFGFEEQLFGLLKQLDVYWQEWHHNASHAGKSGDPQKNLLDILGLHADSAEFHHRFAVSLEQLSNMLKLKQLNLSAMDLGQWLRSLFSGLVSDFGIEKQRPDILNKIFFQGHTLLNGPLVDEAPLSETKSVKAISQDNENYLLWLATSDMDTIRRQDFGRKDGQAVQAPSALLYLMLRHAVMNAYWDSAWNFYHTAGLVAMAPRKEPVFLYLSEENPGQSKFAPLYRPAGELAAKHPSVFSSPNLTVVEQISEEAIIRLRPESRSLYEVRQALDCLKKTPTGALARAFSEHLDLCSYRLDAWQLGLVNQRLEKLRLNDGTPRQGIYLGAYAWLENVKPKTVLQAHTGYVPEAFCGPDDPPLHTAADNAGYIHSPSLNHAVTAAILRNAYITHAGQNNADVTAVNLSSERMRLAMDIIEGVQNGQELGALLGYQFERGLHERYNQAEVDKFIYPLRKKFPLVGNQLNPAPDETAIEAIESRNVINAVSLLRHIDDNGQAQYPFGLAGLPDVDIQDQADAINAEVQRLQNIMDAVSDLLTAESVYQLVRGNYDRAGAVMDALSQAETLPTPEILQTPRSGFGLTHRLCIQFESGLGGHNPYAGAVAMTPRAVAEPGINKWLASIVGNDPAGIACVHVTGFRPAGGPGNAVVEESYDIALQDLKLQPIDLVYLTEDELVSQESLLDRRVALAVRRKFDLQDDVPLRLDYHVPISGKVTLFEMMPLLKNLRKLIVQSRALNAEDVRLPSDDTQSMSAPTTADLNPQGWDVTEIEARVKATRQFFADLLTDLNNDAAALIPSAADAVFDNTHDHLMLAASIGLDGVIPGRAEAKDATAVEDLKAHIAKAVAELNKRLAACQKLPAPAPSAGPANQIDHWMQKGGIMLGQEFTWTAAFALKFSQEMEQAVLQSSHMLRYVEAQRPFPVDEWLYGAARVRPKVRAVENVLLLAENFGATAPVLTPVQLPYKKDDYWLALEYPRDYVFDGDRLLLSTLYADSFDKSKPQAGLLLDEWTEVVPTRIETSGIGFHFDAPNSEPPNTCILAVTPDITGSWKWNDLMATLNETLDLAKKRAVEPQHIDETKFAQFLPGVMVPTTRYLMTLATNLLANVGMMQPMAVIPAANDNES